MKKRVFLFIIAFFSLFLLAGCKSGLSSITVDTTNAKVTYQLGETFSQTGLSVIARYGDGSSANVTTFTVDSSKFNANQAGSYEITVEYIEGNKRVSAKYNVTVNPASKTLSSISLNIDNVKKEFAMGEEFTSEGLVVTAHYSDSTTQVVTNYEVDSSTFKVDQEGTYLITVTYSESSVSKSAVYQVEVTEPVMTSLHIDTEEASTTFVIGDEFSARGIKIFVVFSDGSEAAYPEDDYEIDSSEYNKDELGEYTIVVTLTVDGQELSGSYTVEVVTNIVTISTVQDFLDMREFQNAEGVNSKIYTLANDLDLAGVVLEPTLTTFTGSFDGNGYTIKNASFTPNTSKQGLMFYRIDGAVVKNVRFFACTVKGGVNETIAIIAGECNNTGATFENIEFSCCTVDNGAQNYAALLVGRNETKTVTLVFKNITVKNLTSVKSKQYVGCLVGDVIKGSTVQAENCDIDVSLNASNNISVFSGRNRGADVIVKDAVVRLTIGKSTTSGANQVGVFACGNATCNITVENVAILRFKVESVISSNADLICGRNNNQAGATLTNVYYVDEDCALDSTLTGVSQVAKAEVTSSWMFETVLLKNTVWEADTNKIIKLKLASANTPSEGATVNTLILITAMVKNQFFKGDAFDYTGLLVTAIYTDGCVIAIDEYQVRVLNAEGEEIDAEAFLTASIGEYTVEVSADEVSETYKVHIVEEIGIEIKDDLVPKAYVVGSEFDASKLVVFVNISNGSHTLLKSTEYTITVKDPNGVVVTKLDVAQKYTVEVHRADFVETYEIEVFERLEDIEAMVDVYVDPSVTIPYTDGNLYFKTISDALAYLKSLQLDDQVIKNVYLAEGTYTEKITISLPNLNLIGDTDDYTKVVITYSVASSHFVLDETTTYGTDGSATVTIESSAVNFTASHIFFKNEFAYNGSTLANKQALAVLCDADRSIFYRCGFTSYQDTLEAKTGRQYYYECYIAGAVDFIFGNNATAVFESCTIKALVRLNNGEPDNNNGYVVATKGISRGADIDKVEFNYVFFNCNFTSETAVLADSMSIARPWGVDSTVTLISCTFNEAYSTLAYDGVAKSRYFDMSGNSPLDARFYEYDSKGPGAITEAVAGVTILTEEQAEVYTLENIFKAVNGLMTYPGGDWVVTTDPFEMEEHKYVIYYDIAQVEYTEGDEFVPSYIEAYILVGNGLTGYEVIVYNDMIEKFFDAEGVEVYSDEAVQLAGIYTVKLFVDGEVFAEGQFEVKAKESETVIVTKEFKASEIAESTIARGSSYLDGLFTFFGKTDGTPISISSVTVSDGTNTYTKTIKLTGGKATASTDENALANLVKIVVEKAGKVRVVASQKNATASSVSVKLVLFGSDGVAIETNPELLSATDAEAMSVIEFEIGEAGTYYIGADANGFQLYSIAWIYEEEKPVEMVEVTKEFKASEIAESTIARGSSYLDGLFTFFGKTDGTPISISSVTVSDGTNTYTKTIKLTGGKATASTDENALANLVKIVVEKAGKVRLVASQKNATDSSVNVKLVLFGSDGVAIETNPELLSATDAEAMSVIEFEIGEAGTYYIGADANGFQLYSIAWIYDEEKPEEPQEIVQEFDAALITESTIARGSSYLDGLFTFFGKTDGTPISVSSVTVSDGTNTYTRTIKLTGGKATASTDENALANLVKIVVEKAGKVRLVASQKNATASSVSVKLVLFGSGGVAIETNPELLSATDAEAMSVIEFEIGEAGTYYIGADANGFQLYNIAWITR